MKHARVWYRCEPDYRVLRNRKPAVGQALTPEEQDTLFATARTKNAWLYAYVASTLAFYGGMRACEIKALHWCDIDFGRQLLHVRRSKTPAGWRSPTLNPTCLQVLQELHDRAEKFGFTQPSHFVFPWHGRNKQIDPTRAMTSWRGAWRSMRGAAGLPHARFHDGRHTAITTLAEKGLPDWVIQAQVEHVSPAMMKTYSHIRRQALNEAAAALEPNPARSPTESNPPDSAPVHESAQPSNPTDSSRLNPQSDRQRKPAKSECHSSRHKTTCRTIRRSNYLRKVARRTGRFPQLARSRSGVKRNCFASISPRKPSQRRLDPVDPGALPRLVHRSASRTERHTASSR